MKERQSQPGGCIIRLGMDLDTGGPIIELTLTANPVALSPSEALLLIDNLRQATGHAIHAANPELFKAMFAPENDE